MPYEISDGMLAEIYEAKLPLGMHRAILDALDRISSEISPSMCQFFDADRVVSPLHVVAAITNALLSFKSGRNIAKKLEMEILLKLSADDQISRALEKVGVSDRTQRLGVCIVSRSEEELHRSCLKIEEIIGLKLNVLKLRNEQLLKDLMVLYNVSEEELKSVQAESTIKALELIVIERIAISNISR